MRRGMSLKLHIMDVHLDKFKENMRAYLEEQGQGFHQDVKEVEQRYQGQCNEKNDGKLYLECGKCVLDYKIYENPCKFVKSGHFLCIKFAS